MIEFREPPKPEVRTYVSEYAIMKDFGLNLAEIGHGLNGEMVRGKYVLNLNEDFVNNLAEEMHEKIDAVKIILTEALKDEAINEIICSYEGEEIPIKDIQHILGITEDAMWTHLSRAKRKLRDNPRVQALWYDDYEISAKTKITIKMEG